MADYPVISERRVSELKRRIESGDVAKVKSMDANNGPVALEIIIAHKNTLEHGGMDDLLSYAGFNFSPNPHLDSLYGKTTKYYTFKDRREVWVAFGDNSYDSSSVRIALAWEEKLSPEDARLAIQA
ncbi:MAG: hypothetical protein WCK29_00505 [archaeon]